MTAQDTPELAGWKIEHAGDRPLAGDARPRPARASTPSSRSTAASRRPPWSATSSASGLNWRINPSLAAQVQFRQLNLIRPFPPMGQFDVVFLRNVLIYFDLATKRDILRRVRQVMAPDGHLFLGAAEMTMGVDDAWERVPAGRSSVYRIREEQTLMRALIVDDSRAMRRIVGRILERRRFRGPRGRRRPGGPRRSRGARPSPPELACVDWNMPVMDGLTFITEVRKRPEWRSITLMMVTTESEHGPDRARAGRRRPRVPHQAVHRRSPAGEARPARAAPDACGRTRHDHCESRPTRRSSRPPFEQVWGSMLFTAVEPWPDGVVPEFADRRAGPDRAARRLERPDRPDLRHRGRHPDRRRDARCAGRGDPPRRGRQRRGRRGPQRRRRQRQGCPRWRLALGLPGCHDQLAPRRPPTCIVISWHGAPVFVEVVPDAG